MKKLILLLTFLSLLNQTQAQQMVLERMYKMGLTLRGFGSSTLTREGNVLLTGSYTINPGYQSMFALVKPNTDTLWMRQGPLIAIGGIGIKQALSNGFTFYTTQYYTSPPASGTALHRYDNNWQPQWNLPYATNAFDTGYLLLNAPDSGYFLGGRNIIAGKNRSFVLSRTDSLGNLKWRKAYNWMNGDFLAEMQHTGNGNIIMYGTTGAPQRLKLLLLSQNGDSVLGRQLTIIGGNRNERSPSTLSDILPLSSGGFLLAAEIDTTVASSRRYLGMVVKVDANLQPVWHYINRSLTDNVFFTRSRELTDGSVVMLAHERKGAARAASDKFFLYRFSPAGALLNVYPFTSSIASQVEVFTLEALPDSSFIIGGNGVTPSPTVGSGFYVAKVKIPGLPPALPLPEPMVVTGVKPPVAVADALGQSYPNPTAAEAIIPYALPKNCKAAIIVINEITTGRQVKRYTLNIGESNLQVNLQNLSNGIYSYTLFVDDRPVATKKLSVVK